MIEIQNLKKLAPLELREVVVSTIYEEKVRRLALSLLEKTIVAEANKRYNKLIESF